VTTDFDSLEKLLEAPPVDLGTTAWVEVTEQEIAAFAASTGAESSYLAVSLTNRFLPDLLTVSAASSGVNYGADGITLGPPLRAGDRIRGAAQLTAAAEVKGGVQTTVSISVEVDGASEPACTVESLSRWLA
jgi:acyl dehydratase